MAIAEDLSWDDFERAADLIRVDPPAVRAVTVVEAPRGAVMTYKGERRPVILFEPHHFYRYSGATPYSRTHPHLSRKTRPPAGWYGSYTNQWDKYEEAKSLGDERAAILSCSWGAFQIMGFNHKQAGYDTPEAFRDAMFRGPECQLLAFCTFVWNDPTMCQALRAHDWHVFARQYNGAGYARDGYHTRIAEAYREALSLYTGWTRGTALKAPDCKEA